MGKGSGSAGDTQKNRGKMTPLDKHDIIETKGLTKSQKDLLEYCQKIDWGRIEVIVKDGQPVMVIHPLHDEKLG